jgi:hypothetical protein
MWNIVEKKERAYDTFLNLFEVNIKKKPHRSEAYDL